ncbi:MAG: hypothetical protein A2Z18_06220 [Armatimonadetes bacterium RBG_16_58_9]|nr:MAG: hypothetical protein A2Z18_06220 [Armatimonadetes bacterium RBG_16_58_9]
MPKLREEADFVIVVAHAGSEKAKALANIGGIDVLISTHAETKAVPMKDTNVVDAAAEKIGDCIFFESGTHMGWNVGRLDIELNGGRPKSFTNKLYYLDREYDESPAMLNVYAEYNNKVRELALGQQEKMRAQFKELLKKRGFDPEKHGIKSDFATAEKCKACHTQQYDMWEKGRHARAFKTLEDSSQQFDPECVGCHTTGLGKRGFVNAMRTPELVNVQCEACHGAGRTHADQPAAGYGGVDKETCGVCHSEEIDPEFDYDKYWKRIEH